MEYPIRAIHVCFLYLGGGTFSLRQEVYHSCSIPDGETTVIIGSSQSDGYYAVHDDDDGMHILLF